MSIFVIGETRPTAETIAKAWLETGNSQANDLLNRAYTDVQDFWYRNRDQNGNPSLTKHEATEEWAGSNEPTGVDLLNAMGQQAGLFIALAWAKVAGIVQSDQQFGLGLVDYSRLLPPFDLSWNPDGTLLEATPK